MEQLIDNELGIRVVLFGVPIVTIEYDGTSSGKNEDIIPFLKYANEK